MNSKIYNKLSEINLDKYLINNISKIVIDYADNKYLNYNHITLINFKDMVEKLVHKCLPRYNGIDINICYQIDFYSHEIFIKNKKYNIESSFFNIGNIHDANIMLKIKDYLQDIEFQNK